MTFNGQHRALALLARSPNGRTKTFMLSQGWTRQLLDGLVRAGLATAANERVGRGGQIEVTRIKITDAGRAVLRKPSAPRPHKTFGTKASSPRIKQANGKAGREAERRDLVAEILRLSPPPPGCERRARLTLRKFTIKELLVLVKALRDGMPGHLQIAFRPAWDEP